MISHLNNNPYCKRRASIDVEARVMVNCLQVLMDAGFEIIGSVASDPSLPGSVSLLIQGSALPAECEFRQCSVIAVFEQEAYGSQRITRVKEVILTTFQQVAA